MGRLPRSSVAWWKHLAAEISNRLSGFTYPPPLTELQNSLATIQSLIRNTARFNASQQSIILAALAPFDPLKNIRFRSSSNAEDSESFTAAGLLDSYSGCLADDTDGDTSGPSRCDSSESNERGVFRAIQRVYASFYNQNAFLERLRHGIHEEEVGVGVLVHVSFPDDTELANGVATVDNPPWPDVAIRMVTQVGAASVTNPDTDAQAEEVSIQIERDHARDTEYIRGPYIVLWSSLVPLGKTVLQYDDYPSLAKLFGDVQRGYSALFPGKTRITLDLEYKKITPGWLVVKQVREIPQPPSTHIAPFLINQPVEMCAFEGERSDPFVNHAFKCRGKFQTKNVRLAETNLGQTFFARIQIEFVDGTNIWRMDEDVSSLMNVEHTVDGDMVTDTFPATAAHPAITVATTIKRSVAGNENPWLTIESLRLTRQPDQPIFAPSLGFARFSITNVTLVPRPVIMSNSFLQQREATFVGATIRVSPEVLGDVTVQTRYYWPDPVGVVRNDNTAPLVQFVETTITGVTTTPLRLTGYFSQTYWPSHHNYREYFLFDPWLEPALSAEQREELGALGIRWFLFETGTSGGSMLSALDLNGEFRTIGEPFGG